MMEHMAPVRSSELATKRDLEEFEARLDARMDAKFGQFRSDLLRTVGTWLFASQAAVITAVGVFTALG